MRRRLAQLAQLTWRFVAASPIFTDTLAYLATVEGYRMILIGQYDSPFVRRVAVALNHYGTVFERRALSVFQHFDAMLEINPLGKVPALILPGGDHLYESRAIIEYLESTAPPGHHLTPADDSLRRDMLRVEAVGIGLAEKTYERGIEFSRRSPGTQDPLWIERLERQIGSALHWLETRLRSEWFVGQTITRADLAVVVAGTYVAEKLPALFDPQRYPRLDGYRSRCETLPIFSAAAYSATEAAATGWRPEAASASDGDSKTATTLRRLELRLLQPEIRKSPDEVAALLDDGFVEFGSNGQIYDKQTVIEALQQEPVIERSVEDLRVRELSPGIALVTYRVIRHAPPDEKPSQRLRSSIWKLSDGQWRLVFHQGTQVGDSGR